MTVKDKIIQKLKEIEEKENVKILFAVESGSRAWGFASPDSDYDVRFIYVRKPEDYLKLEEVRDVIEWQLDDVYDINGWDLKKALQLLHLSNPVLFEWVNSPIIYKTTKEHEKFMELLDPYFNCKKGIMHYYHMAKRNYEMYLMDNTVKLKKYFYVLRPLLAVRWIFEKGTYPPVEFEKLVDEELKEKEVLDVVKDLLEKKRSTSELGISSKIEILNTFIEKELKEGEEKVKQMPENDETWDKLNNFFLETLKTR